MQRLLATALIALLLAGCAAHRIDIQQGNILSRDRLALLKPGMEAQQVRFVLGTPLVQDPFHPDRWDYFYLLDAEGDVTQRYNVTIYFEGGKLASIEERGAIPETERDAVRKSRQE